MLHLSCQVHSHGCPSLTERPFPHGKAWLLASVGPPASLQRGTGQYCRSTSK